MLRNLIIITTCLCSAITVAGQGDSLTLPAYPGGAEAWVRFLEERTMISYSEPIDRSAEYSVSVYFTVNGMGQVQHLQIMDVPPALQNGLYRAIRMMPDWEPGRRDGEPVDVRMHVRFRCVVNGNRIAVTWVDEFRANPHREGSGVLKTVIVAAALALMLALVIGS